MPRRKPADRWTKYRNVETFKGVVQLNGFVRSQADIDQAVKVARRVAGVKSVKNDMRIK
jgi:osmotically-inducible protein OsmY